MKHIWALVLSGCLLLMGLTGHAQGKVSFEQEGQPAGSVSAVELNGITYVDVQRAARKLGAQVELFATSKQAKISTKGFFAILTASLDEVIVNGTHQPLPGPVVVRGGRLMAPVDVFLLPSFQLAVNRYIEFKDNTFIIERRFNLELASTQNDKDQTLLIFDAQKQVEFTNQQPTAHTVFVTLKDVVLKRDGYKRLHTDYIISAHMQQVRSDAQLKVILANHTKDWSFTVQPSGQLVFRAGAKLAQQPLLPAQPQTQEASFVPSAATQETQPAQVQPAQQQTTPSILEEDDFEEMVLDAMSGPAASPAVATVSRPAAAVSTVQAPAPAAPAAPAPVAAVPSIRAEPHPLAITAAHKKMRIVVDPGHGGKDPGATRSKYKEKDWNLAVGKELARLLKKGNFEVKTTRDTDVFIALSERSKIANNFKADLFVSVHVNATKNSQAHGFQVYFRSEKATDKEAAETAALENEAMQYEEVHYNFVDALLQSLAKNEYINQSSQLAGYVKNAVYKQSGIGIAVDQKNAIRQANFYVLKGVQSPAILVEMGFISSSKDRAKLAQSAVQKKMAQGIYNGIVNYAKAEGWLK